MLTFSKSTLESDNDSSDTDTHRMYSVLWVTQHEIETILYVVASSKDAKVSISAVATASSFVGFLQQTSPI